jgi:hypothetical protein
MQFQKMEAKMSFLPKVENLVSMERTWKKFMLDRRAIIIASGIAATAS